MRRLPESGRFHRQRLTGLRIDPAFQASVKKILRFDFVRSGRNDTARLRSRYAELYLKLKYHQIFINAIN